NLRCDDEPARLTRVQRMLASRFLSHKEAPKTQKNKTFLRILCVFVANSLRLHLWSGGHIDFAALLCPRGIEVYHAVDGPHRADSECKVRLTPTHARDGEWSDQIEQHTHQICRNSEQRNEHVLEPAEGMMFAKSDDRDDARHHVQKERPKVADERNDNRALWNLRGEIVTPDAKAVPDVLRQSLDGVIRLSSGPGEIEQDGNDRNYRRKDRQCPDRAMRRQFRPVQQSEMFGHLFVTAHGIGHPSSRAHAG